MLNKLQMDILQDLQTLYSGAPNVIVGAGRLALNRKIGDGDRNIYLDITPTSIAANIAGKQAVEYTTTVDLRIAQRVANEADINGIINFCDDLYTRLSKGWIADDYTLTGIEWQGVDRATTVSDVFVTYFNLTFSRTNYNRC